MRVKHVWICLTGCLLGGWLNAAHAQNLNKSEAESRLNQLKEDIVELTSTLQDKRQNWSQEQQRLKKADLEIQSTLKQLHELESQKTSHEQQLETLQLERDDYLDSLDERRQQLARQIVAAFRMGRESRLKLILNQDSPAQFSRTLAYFDYFSRSQADQIQELKDVLRTLDEMQSRINTELSAIDGVQNNLKVVLADLQSGREKRQAILKDLDQQINNDEVRLTEMQSNRQDLKKILDKLSDALADIPTDLGKHASPAKLKGQLPKPLDGRVIHAFGQSRTAGMQWQGWVIEAASGTEVKTVAYGRVAYSDWLRGYGLLMIIDHGDGFMSLYGQNESLRYEVGDWVESGSVIATVGSDPDGRSGLYFEIRKNSKALDPAAWLKR